MMADPSLFESVEPGATITEVAPLPQDPNVRRIKVAGKVVARLPIQAVEALGLEVGRRWSRALAERVLEAIEFEKARRAAFTVLGRRAMSRGEVVARLLQRGHSSGVANRVADELECDQWIDDEAFASSLAEELAQRRSASVAMIVERLMRRRVKEDLAARAAQRALAGIDPVEAAVAFARKRLAQMKQLDSQRAARRIAGALARRGIDEDTITEVLHRLDLAQA